MPQANKPIPLKCYRVELLRGACFPPPHPGASVAPAQPCGPRQVGSRFQWSCMFAAVPRIVLFRMRPHPILRPERVIRPRPQRWRDPSARRTRTLDFRLARDRRRLVHKRRRVTSRQPIEWRRLVDWRHVDRRDRKHGRPVVRRRNINEGRRHLVVTRINRPIRGIHRDVASIHIAERFAKADLAPGIAMRNGNTCAGRNYQYSRATGAWTAAHVYVGRGPTYRFGFGQANKRRCIQKHDAEHQ
jgi:hypothetical protein